MTTKKTIDPNYTEIGNLFNLPILFEVPMYQRGYSWEREQVQDFCEDIFACVDSFPSQENVEHFFGSIVCIEKKSDEVGAATKINILVDGQQRTSTFILFMSIVIQLLKDYCEQLSEKDVQGSIKKSIESLETKYIYYPEYRSLKEIKHDKLSLSKKDKAYFKALINFRELPETDVESNRLLLAARKTIQDHIEKKIKDKELKEKISYLQNIETVFNSCCFILKVTTNNNDQAYKLFQILNDRGRALSAIDLLRANSLGLFDTGCLEESKFQEKAANIWDLITKDSTKDLEGYFSYYYSSYKYTKVRKINLYEKFNKAFFEGKSGEDLYNQIEHLSDSLTTLKDLEQGVWPYKNGSACEWDKNKLKNLVIRLLHTDCLPLLLVATKLKEKKFIDIVYSLEKFFFRYKTICKCRFEAAVKVYHEEIEEINNNPEQYSVQSLKSKLKTLLDEKTNDADFINNIMELEYKGSEEKDPHSGNKLIKYVLIQFEENWAWLQKIEESASAVKREPYIDKSRIFDFSHVSIEHIYPQNAPEAKKDTVLEAEKNKFGNLTLLDRNNNSTIGNKPYIDKRKALLASNYKMNVDLAEKFSRWDINSLEFRTSFIKKHLLNIFKF